MTRSRLSGLFAFLISAVLSSSAAWADQSSTTTLQFDGTNRHFTRTLKDSERHPIFGYEEVPSTCTREVATGSHQECSTSDSCSTSHDCTSTSEEVCRTGSDGQTECTPISAQRCSDNTSCSPVTSCTNVTDYTTETYACTETVRVQIGEATDFNTTANVDVTFVGQEGRTLSRAESFQVRLAGVATQVSIGGGTHDTLFTMKKTESVRLVRAQGAQPGEKEVAVSITIRLIDPTRLSVPLSQELADLAIAPKLLQFTSAKVTDTEYFGVALQLRRTNRYQRKEPRHPRWLVNSDVAQAATRLSDSGDRTLVSLDLPQLLKRNQLRKGTYAGKVSVMFRAPNGETLLNPGTLPLQGADRSKNFELKIK